jgi:hypothetical protein
MTAESVVKSSTATTAHRTTSRPARPVRSGVPVDPALWTVEANICHEAMTLYWQHMGWGERTTDFPELDKRTYVEWGYE